MLYLHCGWPRTSTTSLQLALGRYRERLTAAGVVYPKRWLSKAGPTHHGLSVMLSRAKGGDRGAFEEFKAFLKGCGGQDVLFSAEALTEWLRSTERHETFVRFLDAIQEVTSIRCIWTLRRFDEEARSLYLLWAKGRIPLAPPSEYFAKVRRSPDAIFAGLRDIEKTVGGAAVYVGYDSAGAHNGKLLRAFGIPAELVSEIQTDLDVRPRANVSLSHKQAAALINATALSERAGVELDSDAMRKAFPLGEFEFDRDGRCELFDLDQRRALHEQALAAARRQRFSPYVEFFANSEIAGPPSVEAGPGALDDNDLARLAAHFARDEVTV